jgi:hypothetical protein
MEVCLVYSNIEFIMEGTVPPCTILAAPIRVRLYEEDLHILEYWGIDPTNFIRCLVNKEIQSLKKV